MANFRTFLKLGGVTPLFRVCLLLLVFLLVACARPDEAREQPGLALDPDSQIPQGSPGHGIEKIENRAASTPTPRPSDPMDRPLDPTGHP